MPRRLFVANTDGVIWVLQTGNAKNPLQNHLTKEESGEEHLDEEDDCRGSYEGV